MLQEMRSRRNSKPYERIIKRQKFGKNFIFFEIEEIVLRKILYNWGKMLYNFYSI